MASPPNTASATPLCPEAPGNPSPLAVRQARKALRRRWKRSITALGEVTEMNPETVPSLLSSSEVAAALAAHHLVKQWVAEFEKARARR